MEPRRDALLDDAHLVFVNHEAYFFSSIATRLRFERRPWKWCGTVTDPVTLERFRPERRSPSTVYNGRAYYFADAGHVATFLADPDSYRAARNRMVPPAEGEAVAEAAPPEG